jgi:hypothetical protein
MSDEEQFWETFKTNLVETGFDAGDVGTILDLAHGALEEHTCTISFLGQVSGPRAEE